MTDAIVQALKDLTTTKGRIPRSTFWWFHILLFGAILLLGFLGGAKILPEALAGFLVLPLLLMRIIVEIKRWHDRDKSGWWFLIGLIPGIGPLWVLVECGFLAGTQGDNRFGADPVAMFR